MLVVERLFLKGKSCLKYQHNSISENSKLEGSYFPEAPSNSRHRSLAAEAAAAAMGFRICAARICCICQMRAAQILNPIIAMTRRPGEAVVANAAPLTNFSGCPNYIII